ncbi:NAD-dependent malic enzyme [Neglecta sp. X4]|uniref:NAD(P)-dependent malic enzyme n=1 Tax=unclassified Neglectibacter TaxID=2632164 RepID=UPI00136D6990|nr:NAD-dependent malic enzyme [Neglectibacter sp. 59]NBJ73114.1 NAD-dependent malic enzyme [Neglectibacter sp. X4]NCE81023.1 NAD-dependent malic enzyme [Neglectibacter sp. X58]
MDYAAKALEMHREWKGKIRVDTPCPLAGRDDLSVAYTPGVAAPCLEIAKDKELSYTYTRRGNLVAVVTDGTAVLGLGDIGPEAGMPVMEGKCALFKAFAGVDAFPLCIRSKDVDEIVRTVELLAGSFGGINLEDIAAPRCFEIEEKLQERLDIPVFHDDQHGTAVVTVSAMINALRLTGRKLETVSAVVNGAGAAGTACTRLLMALGLKNVVVCDKAGALYEGMEGITPAQQALAAATNPEKKKGALADVIRGADVFMGFSAPGCLTGEMVRTMAKDPIIFACANPTPEIFPEEALAAGARVVGSGRSDYPNQINNVLAFPGIFRGALDVRAREINDKMKVAAAKALADLISPADLREDNIIPSAFNPAVAPAVAAAVAQAAKDSGAARA